MVSHDRYVDENKIKDYFEKLNQEKITYIIRNNINDEIPGCLKAGKDIDLLVKKEDMDHFRRFMESLGYNGEIHSDNRQFLYGLTDSYMYQNKCDKDGFRVHVFNQLSCKGLLPFWIPLDKEIQKYAWDNKVWNGSNQWWELDKDTMFTYLIVRCIFDKKSFSSEYIMDIEKYYLEIHYNIVKSFLGKIFFRYADRLFDLIGEKRYEEIVEDYLSFSDY